MLKKSIYEEKESVNKEITRVNNYLFSCFISTSTIFSQKTKKQGIIPAFLKICSQNCLVQQSCLNRMFYFFQQCKCFLR